MKLKKKLKAANKAVQLFIKQTIKNYQTMKKKLCKIFAIAFILIIAATTMPGCNVTRKVTTQASYFISGDTTTTIVTKTTETYDATKKF